MTGMSTAADIGDHNIIIGACVSMIDPDSG